MSVCVCVRSWMFVRMHIVGIMHVMYCCIAKCNQTTRQHFFGCTQTQQIILLKQLLRIFFLFFFKYKKRREKDSDFVCVSLIFNIHFTELLRLKYAVAHSYSMFFFFFFFFCCLHLITTVLFVIA